MVGPGRSAPDAQAARAPGRSQGAGLVGHLARLVDLDAGPADSLAADHSLAAGHKAQPAVWIAHVMLAR